LRVGCARAGSAIARTSSIGIEHGIKLGAKLVWMPTFSSRNHLDHHKKDEHFTEKFPQTKKKMLEPIPLTVVDGSGKLLPEVAPILDMIAENDIVLSSGHLHITEIWPLFEEAKRRGVKRLLCNHPTYVIDPSLADIRRLVDMGAYTGTPRLIWPHRSCRGRP
jgi:hypothetical protein